MTIILLGAAIVGFAIGTGLGHMGPGAPAGAGTPIVSASPSAAASHPLPTTPSASASMGPIELEDVPALGGSGDHTTQTFIARVPWQIQWQTQGGSFALTIQGDPNLGKVIDQTGPGEGSISPIPAGTFRIEVAATGPWTIDVESGA